MTARTAASAATPSLALISDGQSRRLAQLIEIRGLCLSAVETDNVEIRDAFAAIIKLDEMIGDLTQPSAVAEAAAEAGR